MVRKLLDANVVIRYLVNDDGAKAERFRQLLKRNDLELLLNDVIVAEIVWVLESYYQISKKEIIEKLQALLAVPVVKANVVLITRALDLFAKHNVDYVDAYIASVAQGDAIEVISYDRDLDKLPATKRSEP